MSNDWNNVKKEIGKQVIGYLLPYALPYIGIGLLMMVFWVGWLFMAPAREVIELFCFFIDIACIITIIFQLISLMIEPINIRQFAYIFIAIVILFCTGFLPPNLPKNPPSKEEVELFLHVIFSILYCIYVINVAKRARKEEIGCAYGCGSILGLCISNIIICFICYVIQLILDFIK